MIRELACSEIACASVTSPAAPRNQLREMKKLSLVFPEGLHQSDDNLKLDIIISDSEGMFYFILRFYIVDFMSVLEMADDPDDMFNTGECWLVAIGLIGCGPVYQRKNMVTLSRRR